MLLVEAGHRRRISGSFLLRVLRSTRVLFFLITVNIPSATKCWLHLGEMAMVVHDVVAPTTGSVDLGEMALVVPDSATTAKCGLHLCVMALVVHDVVAPTNGWADLLEEHGFIDWWRVFPPDAYPSFQVPWGDSKAGFPQTRQRLIDL